MDICSGFFAPLYMGVVLGKKGCWSCTGQTEYLLRAIRIFSLSFTTVKIGVE